jgi:hypothetical protein
MRPTATTVFGVAHGNDSCSASSTFVGQARDRHPAEGKSRATRIATRTTDRAFGAGMHPHSPEVETASLSLLVFAGPVLASHCYVGNYGAAAWNVVTTKGVKGVQDLNAANTINPNSTAIIHPAQVGLTTSGDFIGLGTKTGKGTTGGVANCPTTDNTQWRTYVALSHLAPTFAMCTAVWRTTPPARHSRSCTPSAPRQDPIGGWHRGNGVQQRCVNLNFTSGNRPSSGGESLGTAQIQNIDVYYRGMKYCKPSVGWTDVGTIGTCADTGYRIRKITNLDYWAERS